MFDSIAQIRRVNREKGGHFFSAENMAHSSSEIDTQLYGGRFFVTSEVGMLGTRLWSVRRAEADGRIRTVGGGGEYTSLAAARLAARRAAEWTELEERDGKLLVDGDEVTVQWLPSRKTWSIRRGNRVVAYASSLQLKRPRFKPPTTPRGKPMICGRWVEQDGERARNRNSAGIASLSVGFVPASGEWKVTEPGHAPERVRLAAWCWTSGTVVWAEPFPERS